MDNLKSLFQDVYLSFKRANHSWNEFTDTFRDKLTVADIDKKVKEGATFEEKNALLHLAFSQGNVDVIQKAIQLDINLYGDNPKTGGNILHSAAQGGSDMSLMLNQYFLQEVNINKQDSLYKRTPIVVAGQYNQTKTFEQLANAGADLTLTDFKGNTALHYFNSKTPDLKSIHNKTLKQALNIKNNEGLTPLMCAVVNNNSELAKQLIEAGADVTITHDQLTALDYLKNQPNLNPQLVIAFGDKAPDGLLQKALTTQNEPGAYNFISNEYGLPQPSLINDNTTEKTNKLSNESYKTIISAQKETKQQSIKNNISDSKIKSNPTLKEKLKTSQEYESIIENNSHHSLDRINNQPKDRTV